MKKIKKVGGIKWDKKKKAFMVRINHRGKEYPVKNFTKIFDCKTVEDVEEKIKMCKDMWDRGEEPFDNRTFGERAYHYFNSLTNPKTKSIYRQSYDKHCKKYIHDLKPNQLSQTIIKKIYNGMVVCPDVNSSSTIEKARTYLSPVFKELYEDRKITINYLRKEPIPDLEDNNILLPLNERLYDVDYKIIARKLYNGILKIERDDIRNYILFTLMTARRRAEVFRTTHKHINLNIKKIKATKDITKTKIEDEYPIPEEIIDYLKNSDKEYPLKVDEKSYYKAWKKLLLDEDIKVHQVFRLYDTRHLFTSTMQEIHPEKWKVIDECLSHIPKTIDNTYHSRRFEKRKEIFEEYWEILRTPIEE